MKAQVAIEFLLIALAATFILVGLLTVLLHTQGDALSDADAQALSNAADVVQQELLLAAQVRDGYSRTVTLPIARYQDYSTTHTNTTVTLSSGDRSYTRDTPPYIGTIDGYTMTITKDQGVIRIS